MDYNYPNLLVDMVGMVYNHQNHGRQSRHRHIRRLVGGWVQAHHASSSYAKTVLHLWNEFISPSRAVADKRRARKCINHMYISIAMIMKRWHRIIKVDV